MTVTNLQARADRKALGIAMILMSTLLVSLQEATFKYVSADILVWQIFVLRSVFLVPVLLIVAFYWVGGVSSWRDALRLWPMVRSTLFILMYLATYTAIPVLPLATIAAGLYTAPLFVAALSALLVGEPVRPVGWGAIAIGFAGVLVILRPGADAFTWLSLLPVCGGFFYALAALITRSKCRTTPPPTIALSLSIGLLLTGVIGSAALVLLQLTPSQAAFSPFLLGAWTTLDGSQWGIILLLAALMLGNGLVLPAAYQSAPSVIIATFDYSYLIFATLIGILLFAEYPDRYTIAGMVMIAVAGLAVSRT